MSNSIYGASMPKNQEKFEEENEFCLFCYKPIKFGSVFCNEECKQNFRKNKSIVVDNNKSIIFKCEQCSKEFKTLKALNGHKVAHSRVLKKIECPHCNKEFSSGNYEKHVVTCLTQRKYSFHVSEDCCKDGVWYCWECEKIYKTKQALVSHYWYGHTDQGKKQLQAPERSHDAWNKGKTVDTDERLKKFGETLKQGYASGKIKTNAGFKHSEETKKRMSIVASSLTFQRKCKKTTPYTMIDGNVVNLDSSWEVEIAQYLDKNKIKWVRPVPIPYTIDNQLHHYYPDFYLPDYDVYLDPKNSYVVKQNAEKLAAVFSEHKIVLFYGERKNIIEKLEEHMKG